MVNWFGQSWQTTVCGVCAIVIKVAESILYTLDANPSTEPNWNEVVVLALVALGLMRAMDNSKHSKDNKDSKD